MQPCEPNQMEMTMLVAVGKGIELEVDVTRLNNEVRDHHRLVLRLNRLAFFEGDDLLRARTELRIVLHRISARQFVD
jgi:hypothetical protein